jgi:diaminohydroxyphosphoribosylaminopyrimidine deaminase/5-amino-6-(5-phosphoribosylamino)uracil reductase
MMILPEEDAIVVGRVTDEREHPQLNVREWVGDSPKRLVIDRQHPLNLDSLHAHGIQSLIVEGGAKTLQTFINQGLWDEIRLETAAITVSSGTRAPQVPENARLVRQDFFDGNHIAIYTR